MSVLNAFQMLRPRGAAPCSPTAMRDRGPLQPRVLEMMREAGRPMTNREIAQMCDVPVANGWSAVRGLHRNASIRIAGYDKRGAAMYEVAP